MMKTHKLLKDQPFEALDIPAPTALKTTADHAQLTQHLISEYRLALNLYRQQHGFEARQQLLIMMVLLTSEIMPAQHPEHIRNYPKSLGDIYALVGSVLVAGADRKAG
jgi:hypothetical protein